MSADISTRFCQALAMNGTNATILSTDWIDMKKAQDNAGGREPEVEIAFTTTGSGAGTVRFELGAVDSAGANFAILDTTKDLTPSTLIAPTAGVGVSLGGTRLTLRMSSQNALPSATLTHLRLRAITVGAVANLAVTAQLVDRSGTVHPDKAYAAGF